MGQIPEHFIGGSILLSEGGSGQVSAKALTGLTPGVTYYFAVTAYDTAYNESGFSNEVYGTATPVNDPPTVPITLQAENFATKTTGVPTADAYCIWSNGYIEDSVNFPVSGNYSFIVTAFGSAAAGLWPEMEIRIDQSTIGSVTVNSGIWGTYVIEGNISAGIHKVAIAFTNDYYNPPEDRNLFVDSIFISSSAHLPYRGTPSVIPGTIQAEDFDTGGEGVAYHDLDASNNGGQYRPSESVDIETTTDTGGGYNVGWMEAGEWLQYTVNVATAGTYNLDVRVAANGNGGTFHIEFNGVNKTGSMTIPNTGGWQVWQTIRKTGISLSVGQQVMKIVLDANGPISFVGNINDIVLSATTN